MLVKDCHGSILSTHQDENKIKVFDAKRGKVLLSQYTCTYIGAINLTLSKREQLQWTMSIDPVIYGNQNFASDSKTTKRKKLILTVNQPTTKACVQFVQG